MLSAYALILELFPFQDVYNIKYVLTESPKKSKGNGNGGKDKEEKKTKEEEMAEAVRDLKISWITK